MKAKCSCDGVKTTVAKPILQQQLFAVFYDQIFVNAVYEKRQFVASILDVLKRKSVQSILDCAAGTGFPALLLRKAGMEVDCTDMDPFMIEVFKKNARRLKVPNNILRLKWSDLSNIGKQYDYVMCRGNSLAYDESWGEEGNIPPGNHKIYSDLQEIAKMVKPGGYLHVDIPKKRKLGKSQYSTEYNGEVYRVEEEVFACKDGRHWFFELYNNSEHHKFDRWSSSFSFEQLQEALTSLGFSETNSFTLQGERKNFRVIIARKGLETK